MSSPAPVAGTEKSPVPTTVSSDKFQEEMNYLQRAARLAQKKGARVIFFQAPVQNERMYAFFNRIKTHFNIVNPEVIFLNMNDYADEIGLAASDFRDEGHLYLWGMKKATDWWVANVQSAWNLKNRKGTTVESWWNRNASWWNENTRIYEPVTR